MIIKVADVKGAIALDYSTFLEEALMHYAAETIPKSALTNDMFRKWKAYRNRNFSKH